MASSHHFFAVAVGSGGDASRRRPWCGSSWLVTLNVLVLILNLIPAFPLDGAQIVHALMWWRTDDRNRATRVVGRIGQGFALLLGAAGLGVLVALLDISGVWLAFIGLFVYQSATGAVLQGSVDQRIQRLTVADVMDPEPVTIPAETGLLDAQEHFFLRYRWPWFAVVDPARHFLGVVRSERVDAEIAAGRPALPVVRRAGGEPAGPHRAGSAAGVAAALGGSRTPGRDGRRRRRRRAARRRHRRADPPGAAPCRLAYSRPRRPCQHTTS